MSVNSTTIARRLGSLGLSAVLFATQVSLVAPASVSARTTVAPEWKASTPMALGHLGGQNYSLSVSGATLMTTNGSTVQAFDVSDPQEPRLVGDHFGYDRSYQAGVLADGVYYTHAGTSVEAFDVSDPTTVKSAGTLQMTAPGYSGYDAAIDGDLLFLPQEYDGLNVIDISGGPTGMAEVQKLDAPGYNEYWWTAEAADGYLYAWRSGGGFTGVEVYDAHVRPLAKVASLPVGSTSVCEFSLEADTLYVSEQTAGGLLRVVDVSEPASATVVGSVVLGDVVHSAAAGGYVYAGRASYSTGYTLSVVNATDPAHPMVVNTLTLPAVPRGLAVDGGRLYVLTDVGFSIYDLSKPGDPALIGGFSSLPYASYLAASASGTLFVASEYGPTIAIADASDPTSITPIGTAVVPGTSVLGTSLSGDVLGVLSRGSDGKVYLSFLEIKEAGATALLGSELVTGSFDSLRFEGTRAILFGPGGLSLWDTSDPSAASQLAVIAPLGKIGDVATLGNRLFASYDTGIEYGVASIDISVLSAPHVDDTAPQSGLYPPSGAPPLGQIALAGERLFASGYGKGLLVLDVSNPLDLSWSAEESGKWEQVDEMIADGTRLWVGQNSGSKLRLLDTSGDGIPTEVKTIPVRVDSMCKLARSMAVGSGYDVLTFADNAAPNAVNDGPYDASEDVTLSVPAGGVLGNDTDAQGDPLTAALASGPEHGTLSLKPDGSFSYIAEKDWSGTDTFSYRTDDGFASSAPATVTIDVAPVNDAPVAGGDVAECASGATIDVGVPGVLANDTDIEMDALSATLTAEPEHGSVTLEDDGSYSYTADADWSGIDTFAYKAFDGDDYSEPATVSIAVRRTTAFSLTSKSAVLIAYGSQYFVYGSLKAGTDGVEGVDVILQSSANGTTFSDTSATVKTKPGGSFMFTLMPRDKTYYRVRFAGNESTLGSRSGSVYALPRAKVSNPVAPSKMRKSRYYTVYGYLWPKHSSTTADTVRIYKWRYVNRKWKSYGYVTTKTTALSSYSKYSKSMKLPYSGKWRLAAYATADSGHAGAWSSGYDYVTVP